MTRAEAANAAFQSDVYATQTTGIVIEDAAPQYARCSLRIDGRHQNAAGRVMGGAIYTLADFTFAVATNFEQSLTVTSVSQISYLAAPAGSTLYAESRMLKDGKRSCFYEISVTDDLGTAVAVVTVSGMHLAR